jgi:hypothetical protein
MSGTAHRSPLSAGTGSDLGGGGGEGGERGGTGAENGGGEGSVTHLIHKGGVAGGDGTTHHSAITHTYHSTRQDKGVTWRYMGLHGCYMGLQNVSLLPLLPLLPLLTV